ncbi:MAG: diaminopimelate decarboxylase [Phycisphaeraceae bacterium]|nr:diaminopimelate decarboxylase [Phycisphaeraceae bacterium]
MDDFQYRNGQLFAEDVNIDELAAKVGTPMYVYSKKTLLTHFNKLRAAFAAVDPVICYSIKSCGNINLLKLLAGEGAGMDVVSGGELYRAQLADADMSKIVYAGVGKTDAEIEQGIEAGIGYFNIESEAEFENIAAIAQQMGKTAHAALRVNPDIYDPKTHDKTTTGKKETKFGVDIERAKRFFDSYGNNPHCKPTAIHLHIGSPIYSPEPYVKAIEKALVLIDELRTAGYTIDTLDIGGGFAADYESGKSPDWQEYADAIVPLVKDKGLKIILEPGRTISGNAGILVTRVQYLKKGGNKKFVIVDTGMHHLIRPAMYDAFHFLWPTQCDPSQAPVDRKEEMDLPGLELTDVVGPVCESSDVFAKQRMLPSMERGDLIAIYTCGAYGMVMASNYNAMVRPPEVLVDGDTATIIRQRETYEQLVTGETQPQAV